MGWSANGVARPSRLRVAAASRRQDQNGAGRPDNPQPRTPSLHATRGLLILNWRWRLAHHGSWFFVLAQSEIRRLAQMMVARPFSKTHLANQLGTNPTTAFHLSPAQTCARTGGFLGKIYERAISRGQLSEFVIQEAKCRLVESRPHLGGKAKVFAGIVTN